MKEFFNDNIVELYLRLLPVQIFLVIVSSLSGIINGLVIGNYLSDTAMAALGLVMPMTAFLGAMASIVSGGAGILCGNFMGRGEKKKVDQVFSVSIILLLVFSVILTSVGIFLAEPLARLFSADQSTFADTVLYIRGTSIGILPQLVIPCLMTFLQMCNRSNVSLIMTVILGGANAVLCLAGIHLFRTDIFGIGVATSLSKFIVLILMIIYFMINKDLVRFNGKDFDLKMSGQLLSLGLPASLAGILYSVRNVFINSYAGQLAGTDAVKSLAILSSFGGFFDAFNVGVGSTLTMLASVFIGERDPRSLKRLMKVTLIIGMSLAVLKVLYAFTLGKWTAVMFGANEELAGSTAELIRFYSLSSPLNILTLIMIGVYQCLERIMLCNFIYLFNCIITPLACCALLSKVFGLNAIWSCYPVAEAVTLLIIYIHSCIRKKGVSGSVDDLLYLDEEFSTDSKFSMTVKNKDDVLKVSRSVEQFCRDNGIDDRRAMLSGLCLEEMVGNIVDHGFTKDRKEHTIDVLAIAENDEVLLRLRDDCVPFDPNTRAGMIDGNDPCRNIGIRMVSGIASKMNYQSTFGMNVLSIKL